MASRPTPDDVARAWLVVRQHDCQDDLGQLLADAETDWRKTHRDSDWQWDHDYFDAGRQLADNFARQMGGNPAEHRQTMRVAMGHDWPAERDRLICDYAARLEPPAEHRPSARNGKGAVA